jgi:hypothetical protein
MVDIQYVFTQISFKSQNLGVYFRKPDYTLFKEFGYTLPGFYKDLGLVPSQSLSQTLAPTS